MAEGDGDCSDFTFCQVLPPVDLRQPDSPKALPSLQTLKLEGPSNSSQPPTDASSLGDNFTNPTTTNNPDALAPLQKKKTASRAKVPFEKGYSQMDWLKLTRTHPDLAGLNGTSNRKLITLEEVKQHKNTEGHIWTVLKGRVYNISPYLKFHPGGVDMLMKAAGKDCTSLFNKYHAWVNAEFLMEKCLVGFLDPNE